MNWEKIVLTFAALLVSAYIFWGVAAFVFNLVTAVNNNSNRITNIERALTQVPAQK